MIRPVVTHPVHRIRGFDASAILKTLEYVIPRLDEPVPEVDGYGICCVAGGKYLRYAHRMVRIVREMSDMPIHIYHLGPKELDHPVVPVLREMGVTFKDALPLMAARNYQTGNPGWMAKSASLIDVPFRHCLFLDADAYPLIPPEDIFAHGDYTTGLVVFPDVAPCRKSDAFFSAFGMRHDPLFTEWEAGQFVVDKVRLWDAVQLYAFMNGRPKPFHEIFWGDKDLLPMACIRLGIPFTTGRPPQWIKRVALRHFLSDETPAFEHWMEEKRGKLWLPERLLELDREFRNITQLTTV